MASPVLSNAAFSREMIDQTIEKANELLRKRLEKFAELHQSKLVDFPVTIPIDFDLSDSDCQILKELWGMDLILQSDRSRLVVDHAVKPEPQLQKFDIQTYVSGRKTDFEWANNYAIPLIKRHISENLSSTAIIDTLCITDAQDLALVTGEIGEYVQSNILLWLKSHQYPVFSVKMLYSTHRRLFEITFYWSKNALINHMVKETESELSEPPKTSSDCIEPPVPESLSISYLGTIDYNYLSNAYFKLLPQLMDLVTADINKNFVTVLTTRIPQKLFDDINNLPLVLRHNLFITMELWLIKYGYPIKNLEYADTLRYTWNYEVITHDLKRLHHEKWLARKKLTKAPSNTNDKEPLALFSISRYADHLESTDLDNAFATLENLKNEAINRILQLKSQTETFSIPINFSRPLRMIQRMMEFELEKWLKYGGYSVHGVVFIFDANPIVSVLISLPSKQSAAEPDEPDEPIPVTEETKSTSVALPVGIDRKVMKEDAETVFSLHDKAPATAEIPYVGFDAGVLFEAAATMADVIIAKAESEPKSTDVTSLTDIKEDMKEFEADMASAWNTVFSEDMPSDLLKNVTPQILLAAVEIWKDTKKIVEEPVVVDDSVSIPENNDTPPQKTSGWLGLW